MQISKIAESSIISAFIGIYLLLFSIGTQHLLNTSYILGFPGSSASRESACNAGDPGSISGLGRSSGAGHGNPLQYSCLENPHGQRSLVGYSLWGCKESDMTERLSLTQKLVK